MHLYTAIRIYPFQESTPRGTRLIRSTWSTPVARKLGSTRFTRFGQHGSEWSVQVWMTFLKSLVSEADVNNIRKCQRLPLTLVDDLGFLLEMFWIGDGHMICIFLHASFGTLRRCHSTSKSPNSCWISSLLSKSPTFSSFKIHRWDAADRSLLWSCASMPWPIFFFLNYLWPFVWPGHWASIGGAAAEVRSSPEDQRGISYGICHVKGVVSIYQSKWLVEKQLCQWGKLLRAHHAGYEQQDASSNFSAWTTNLGGKEQVRWVKTAARSKLFLIETHWQVFVVRAPGSTIGANDRSKDIQ